MAAMVILVAIIIQTVGKSLVMEQSHRFIRQKAETIITQLGQRVLQAETLSNNLSVMAGTLPHDTELYKKMAPQLLYTNQDRSVIAGGGIWPEPYAFSPKKKRRSFFWGLNPDNEPVYVDDYNDLSGPGYHHEAWYVTAKYRKNKTHTWSASYLDPYTLEPMVTCTTPILVNTIFRGVSTIDLKLSGIKNFFNREAAVLKGYIFAVDRNNRFLSFPDDSLVKQIVTDPVAGTIKTFITTKELSKKEPAFDAIHSALTALNNEMLKQSVQDDNYDFSVIQAMAEDSPQVSIKEAELIMATPEYVSGQHVNNHFYGQLSLEEDLVLKEAAIASIFLMPGTGWKIIIVSPTSYITASADLILRQVLLYLAAAIFLCLALIFLYLNHAFITPLHAMTNMLIKTVKDKKSPFSRLPETRKDELGDLVYWFNRRTEDLKNANAKLEQEIHERNKVETALRESDDQQKLLYEKSKKAQEVYRSLINSSSDAIVIYDLEEKTRYVSPAFTKLFGWPLEDIQDRPIPFLPESEKRQTRKIFRELIKSGKPVKNFETKRYTKTGEVLYVSISMSRYNDHNGRPVGILTVLRDLSEKKQLEIRLGNAQRMEAIGTLAGGIAHDFNNILFPILGYVELLLEESKPGSPQNKNLNEVLKAALRARDLVKQILSFSRYTKKEKKPLAVKHIIKETLKLIRSSIPTTITISSNISNDCDLIMADPTEIHQVAMNLLTNAFHSMEETGGILSVTLSQDCLPPDDTALSGQRDGEFIHFCVEDTGIGIAPDIIDRVFDPYFTTKKSDKGTGLGLSVVHGIVKSYDGEILINSSVGKGTRVDIFLPIIKSEKLSLEEYTLDTIASGTETILIVDDEEPVVQMEKLMLERLGYGVTALSNSYEALMLFKRTPDSFDLVITDMTMPNLTGEMLAMEMRLIRADIPIIIATGFSETMNPEKAKDMGINGFLLKPLAIHKISTLIRKVLD